MRLNLWVVVPLLFVNVSAYSGSDVSPSPLLTPNPDGFKLQLNLLELMRDAGDLKAPREKRQYSYYFELYVGTVDIESTLKPQSVSAIRSLPEERLSGGSILRQGPLMSEILATAGIDLESYVYVKTTASARDVTIPVKRVPVISINWGEDHKEKKSALINLRFPVELLGCGDQCKENGWGMAAIGKVSPFKEWGHDCSHMGKW